MFDITKLMHNNRILFAKDIQGVNTVILDQFGNISVEEITMNNASVAEGQILIVPEDWFPGGSLLLIKQIEKAQNEFMYSCEHNVTRSDMEKENISATEYKEITEKYKNADLVKRFAITLFEDAKKWENRVHFTIIK